MRRANIGVMTLAGIQVVVDTFHPCLFESLHFVFVHEPQGAADVDTHLAFDLAHDSGDLSDFFVRGSTPAVNDAVAHGTGCFSALGAFQKLFLREERVAIDGRLGYGRLRAVVAILWT